MKPSMMLWLSFALCVGCGDYNAVATGVCGNLVTEPGEQCDGQADCIADGAFACRLRCEAGVVDCPGALGCSADGACIAPTGAFIDVAAAQRFEMPADSIVVGDVDGDRRDDVIGVGESIRVRFGAVRDPLTTSYEKRIRPPTGPAAIGQIDGVGGLDVVFPTAEGIFTLVSNGRALESIPYTSAATLPSDAARECAATAGWAMCRAIDLNRDGRIDRIGFRTGFDNVEIELGRTNLPPLPFVIDTVDIVTDVTVGDFDGDGFGDLAYATRSATVGGAAGVHVVYGAPQPDAFVASELVTSDEVAGIAATDMSQPADGIDDIAVSKRRGETTGVAVYLGDSARDLSAPFALDGGRGKLDVPYALVAGEFVGGQNSGVDVMAYARNPAQPGKSFFWWLRGTNDAQLSVGAVDEVDNSKLDFINDAWQVGDLVTDLSVGNNGPDEVIGLSPVAEGCTGPALTVAVPSARFTATALIRSACLAVPGSSWQPTKVGLVRGSSERAISIAQRGTSWWLGQAARLDEATANKTLTGVELELPAGCRAPQIWQQSPNAGTAVSWSCDSATNTQILVARYSTNATGGAKPAEQTVIATVSRGAQHLTGDFNGDGLVDVAVRQGRELTVLLQCSEDMVGTTPGC